MKQNVTNFLVHLISLAVIGLLPFAQLSADDHKIAIRKQKFHLFSDLAPEQKREILIQRARELSELQRSRGRNNFRVLVVGAGGGGGHRSSGFSIKKVLSILNPHIAPRHHIIYEESLRKSGFFEISYCEPMYFESTPWNVALDNHNTKMLETLQRQKFYADILINAPVLKEQVFSNISSSMENPDVIIQAQVLSTKRVVKIAERLGADSRLVPTDFMLDTFVSDLENGSELKIDLGIEPDTDSTVKKTLTDKNLQNHIVTGYPVRYEFLTQAEKLRSTDPEIKQKAVAELDAKFLEEDGIKKDDKTILMMMGARGTARDLMAQYIKDIAMSVSSLTRNGNKVHLFVAKILPDELTPPAPPTSEGKTLKEYQRDLDEYANAFGEYRRTLAGAALEYIAAWTYVKKLEKEIAGINKNFVLHLQGKMEADKIARLMYKGVSFVKTGGASAGELLCMGGYGVFPMDISHYIKWEKHAADLFAENGWGMPIPVKQTSEARREFIANALWNGFEKLESNRESMPRNFFHLDWAYLFIEDAISRLELLTIDPSSPKSTGSRKSDNG